jgi:pentatricopeptide repeat protein
VFHQKKGFQNGIIFYNKFAGFAAHFLCFFLIFLIKAFREAGQPEEGMRLLRQLLDSGISEKRYHETTKHFWLLATERLNSNKVKFFFHFFFSKFCTQNPHK